MVRLYQCNHWEDLTAFLKQDYANNLYFYTYLHHIKKDLAPHIMIARAHGDIVLALLLTPVHCCISTQNPGFIQELADQIPAIDSLHIVGRRDLHEPFLNIIRGPKRGKDLYTLCEWPLTAFPETLQGQSRKAGPGDLEVLIDFYAGNDMLPGAKNRLPEILSWGSVYMIQVDQHIAACALTTTETEDAAMIGAIYTQPKYRGNGYARDCISSLCSELFNKHKKPCLFYKTENESLKELYESLGFIEHSPWILATRK